jgi:hypothetical protein
MQITDILNQLGGTQSMARELGLDGSQAEAGMAALVPAILGGLKKQANAQPGGLDGLVGMLGSLGGGGLLDDVLGTQPTNVGRGNEVLGQVLGSKDVSRTVAQNAAAQTGIDPSVLKKMLPMVAMLVTGYMAKQRGAAAPAASAQGSDLGSLLGKLTGGGQGGAGDLASLLDMNKDGNPLDDVLNLAGKLLR